MLTRCIVVWRVRKNARPAEELHVRFGGGPVYLTMLLKDFLASPEEVPRTCQGRATDSDVEQEGSLRRVVYVFQVDARVDAKHVCEQEGYAYGELYEEEIDLGVYNAEHRVELIQEAQSELRRRSSARRGSAVQARRGSARSRRGSDARRSSGNLSSIEPMGQAHVPLIMSAPLFAGLL